MLYKALYFFLISFLLTLSGCDINPSRFDQIGVVEGFYGNPWSHEARLDLVRFMGDVGMNTYYYAPKDDPYHRSKWRDAYEGEKLQEFSELTAVSKEAGVDLYFAISPGLDIVYSNADDFAALTAKLKSMTELGVEHIALFLDDVPQQLRHEEDRILYDDLADAHIDLINKLWEELESQDIKLVVCPTTYTSAWGSRVYIEKLGEGVPHEIPLFWTGEDVAIAEITEKQTRQWGDLMNRKPLIWDNFPVNDFEGWRPILGPLRGRDAALPEVAKGIVANPMDLPYTNMIPLYTVADYANAPNSYDPEESISHAILHLAGESAMPHVMPIVQAYADYGWTDNIFTPIYTPGKPLDEAKILAALDTLSYHIEALKSEKFQNNNFVNKFVNEIEPFIQKTETDLNNLLENDFTTKIIKIPYSKEWGDNLISIESQQDELVFQLKSSDIKHNSEWIIILTEYENPPQTWLQPSDVIIRWKVGQTDSARADHFHLTSFTQRGISDIQVHTITSFFEHFTVPSDVDFYSERITMDDETIYQVKIQKPINQSVRFNSFLNPNGEMLSDRPYLGNPHTYPLLRTK